MSTVAQTAELVHGFTMAEVEHASRRAMALSYVRTSLLDASDREETSWFGVIEYLYACGCGRGVENCTRVSVEDWPTFRDLVDAGSRALNQAANDSMSFHGRDTKRMGEEAPKFAKYWRSVTGGEFDFTDRLADLWVLPQMLSVLTDGQYEAIVTLAAHGSMESAAAALGVRRPTLSMRVSDARKRMWAVWYAPDTPPNLRPHRNDDSTCRYGHDRDEHSYRNPSDNAWICRLCNRNAQRRRRARGAGVAAA